MNHLKAPLSMPVRSDLYSPEPREHDWGMGESLASYVGRLAESHSVSPCDLLAYLAAKAPFGMPFVERTIRAFAGSRSYQLNGMESNAHRWSTLVANQTLRKGIEQMTLLPWRHLIAPYHLLHRHQHWCPECLDRWRTGGQPLYWPLLWSLHTVTICPIDRLPLESRCHHCRTRMRPVAAHARIGFCPNCEGWLGFEGRSGRESAVLTGGTRVTEEALKLAAATRAMLAASPLIRGELTIHKLTDLLNQCAKVSRCSHSTLARRLGRSYLPVYDLRHHQRKTVASVLQLLACMELDIADFVREPIAVLVAHHLDSFVRSLTNERTGDRPPERNRGKRVSTELLENAQALLEAGVAEAYPPSVETLARRASVSTGSLRYYYPDLCRTIMEKRQLHSRREEVRRVLIEAANAEVPPASLHILATQLKLDTQALHENFHNEVAAFQARRAEWDKVDVQKKLEGILEMDPPLRANEVAHRLGQSTAYLKQQQPQLYQAILQRYAEYQHADAREREQQARAAVREAVLQLHASGQFPTKVKVAKIIRADRWTILRETERGAFAEIMNELGLRQH